MRRTLIPLLMLPVVPLAAQEPADSVQRALDEVTVEAARQYVTPEKAVYIPEEKQKKASSDAVALLARMSIPSLRVNALQQTVSTAAGQDVKIFIDFLPATSDDITGMRMKDVRRVEVLDYPDDPRFHGAEHVVNFIMQKYEYGGYAKVYNQLFTTFSDLVERPRANAKFSYRRMTYDLVVGGDVCHGNQLSQEEHSTFLFPGLTPSEEITRDQMPDGDGRLRYHSAYTTFRAVYNADKMQIANSVGFNYTRQPHFDTFSRTSFAGIGLPSEQTASLMQRLWRTLEWNGDYYFALPHNFTLTVNPIVNYSYSERNSTYTVANLPSIENFATSKSTAARLNTRLNRKVNDRITLWADISGSFSRNSVEYAGTSPGKVTLDHSFFGPGVGVSLRLPSFYASADAGYAMEWSDTGQSEDTPRYPYVHLSANYTFSQKLSVGLFTQFASNTPDAADRSPVMQQQNEFMWNCGNPYLTSSRHFTFQAWGNWMPSNLFQMSGYVTYYHLFDNCRQIYRPEIAPDAPDDALVKGQQRRLQQCVSRGELYSETVEKQSADVGWPFAESLQPHRRRPVAEKNLSHRWRAGQLLSGQLQLHRLLLCAEQIARGGVGRRGMEQRQLRHRCRMGQQRLVGAALWHPVAVEKPCVEPHGPLHTLLYIPLRPRKRQQYPHALSHRKLHRRLRQEGAARQ